LAKPSGIAASSSAASGIGRSAGILVALLEREVSGEGQWVQSSLLGAQISLLDFQAARWLIAKDVPGQAGNDHPTSIPTGVFPTRDGHINIAASGKHIFRRFCQTLDLAYLLQDLFLPTMRPAPETGWP
jgi:formyl-CoA transferase